ncbi:UDP-N-acetylmuramoyl-tripeptide--D-alanyl-D-alanine ligase [Pseudanabaena sp. PCC 6802]|uniref:UDP-N-acetylmuramoyl-tripeptide--D-alanyl-D- alanine ligase n=1 Tax=Pseudanabaena sp. PCC 6802 TaxID=118173 RepID=UPI00034C9E54|nr:UDP-N-acetylmuramoyl-tripeptide--D-alanyl-D-alanine ligase [Pseudanabaena sp. PCC 6802]
MTCKCTVGDAIAAMSAKFANVNPQALLTGICTDSRKLQSGQLFVALVGENFDGHEFVASAIGQGAIAAVVQADRFTNNASDLPLLMVDDTLTAYQAIASWWRQKCNLPVVAVTGSAGKTTTKELIAALLGYYTEPGKSVHKSAANYNNDIGVAQTLLAIDPSQHSFVVVEMGMRGLGEIARLARVAQPDVSVITNIGTAHIGRLGSQAAIATAKCELLEQTPPDGIAVLNGEDDLLMKTAGQVWHGRTLTYGLDAGDINGELQGDILCVRRVGRVGQMAWQMPIPGRHNALNFLAALGVLQALDLDWSVTASSSDRIENLSMPAGRSQVYHLDRDITILDETYNASPEATIAALHLLASTPARRRWAVLGTMKELGEMSKSLHVKVGETVRNLGIDRLLVLTDGESDAILLGAGRDFPGASSGSTHAELTEILLKLVEPGDRLLFKASRSIGMDLVVKEFQQAWQARSS